jgi:hypothetical protein
MRAEGEVLRFPKEHVEAWARFDTFFEEEHERLPVPRGAQRLPDAATPSGDVDPEGDPGARGTAFDPAMAELGGRLAELPALPLEQRPNTPRWTRSPRATGL